MRKIQIYPQFSCRQQQDTLFNTLSLSLSLSLSFSLSFSLSLSFLLFHVLSLFSLLSITSRSFPHFSSFIFIPFSLFLPSLSFFHLHGSFEKISVDRRSCVFHWPTWIMPLSRKQKCPSKKTSIRLINNSKLIYWKFCPILGCFSQ